MGQIFDRIRRIVASESAAANARDISWAEDFLTADDDELRRAIDELSSASTTSTPSAAVIQASEVLGVSLSATPDEIKRAYRAIISTCHPDRFASASEAEQRAAANRTSHVNAAYIVLKHHHRFS